MLLWERRFVSTVLLVRTLVLPRLCSCVLNVPLGSTSLGPARAAASTVRQGSFKTHLASRLVWHARLALSRPPQQTRCAQCARLVDIKVRASQNVWTVPLGLTRTWLGRLVVSSVRPARLQVPQAAWIVSIVLLERIKILQGNLCVCLVHTANPKMSVVSLYATRAVKVRTLALPRLCSRVLNVPLGSTSLGLARAAASTVRQGSFKTQRGKLVVFPVRRGPPRILQEVCPVWPVVQGLFKTILLDYASLARRENTRTLVAVHRA